MKKKIFYIFCILLSVYSCDNQSPVDEDTTGNANTGENSSAKNNWNRSKLVSTISYNSDGISEYVNMTYTYDSQGREVGFTYYLQGKLIQENKNYSYNNKECTYTYNSYSDNKLQLSRKSKVVYYDNSWDKGKLVNSIMYEENGISEYSNMTYNYDSQGREIGFAYYLQGKLIQENKNYTYNNKECTYTYNSYTDSKLQLSRKFKVVYYDNSWNRGKLVSSIMYEENGTSEYSNMTYNYDSQGREIGFTNYLQGKLIQEFKNYSYNNKECTYTYNYYNNGTLNTTQKYKVLYY